MRGRIPHQPSMLALVSPDEFVPTAHLGRHMQDEPRKQTKEF